MRHLSSASIAFLVLWSAPVPCAAQITLRASVSTAGAKASSYSENPCLTPDGRYVAFESLASNLVGGDTNGLWDIFVRDLLTGVTERVSVGPSGAQANGNSGQPCISDDGRFVAFESLASNLVAGDTVAWDIFVHDRWTHTTERVSLDSNGTQHNGACHYPSLSADGRLVSFWSSATNLVAGDTNNAGDAFVHDRASGVTERVSLSSTGAQGNAGSGDFPSLSADGRFVVFDSWASNLVPNDTNGTLDVFLRDRWLGITERASVGDNGQQGSWMSGDIASISADGRFVAFYSAATNLVSGPYSGADGIFVRDRLLATTVRASVSITGGDGDSGSMFPAISRDGRFVAFYSWATNLVVDDTNGNQDAFVRDLQLSTTERVSVSTAGVEGIGDPVSHDSYWEPGLSADAAVVAFASNLLQLVPGDSHGLNDVFVRQRQGCSAPVAVHCTAKANSSGCTPSVSANGSPSASSSSAFTITASQVLAQQSGLLFYGVSGPNATSHQAGYMCVRAPLQRTPVQLASADGAPPCIGRYTFDFNAHIASGIDAALVAGQPVWAQFWSRDFLAPFGSGLTDAVTFVICP